MARCKVPVRKPRFTFATTAPDIKTPEGETQKRYSVCVTVGRRTVVVNTDVLSGNDFRREVDAAVAKLQMTVELTDTTTQASVSTPLFRDGDLGELVVKTAEAMQANIDVETSE